jgi:chemotaxis protein MotB
MTEPHNDRDPDNLHRWLLTYSDLITLLLGFFVILFAISQISESRYKAVTEALRDVFGEHQEQAAGSIAAVQPIRLTRQMMSDTLGYALDQALAGQTELAKAVTLVPKFEGIALRFQDRILFDLGDADIRPEARGLLLTVAKVLIRFPNHLRVDGHTDDLPIHNAKFASNWQLSSARAANVAHFLQKDGGIDGRRIAAAGYGPFQAALPNISDENRAVNRRVEIVVLDE